MLPKTHRFFPLKRKPVETYSLTFYHPYPHAHKWFSLNVYWMNTWEFTKSCWVLNARVMILICCYSVNRSVVSDSATPQTVAHQAPLSMEFSRQEYWSISPFPSPERGSSWPTDPAQVSCIAGVFFTMEPSWSPKLVVKPRKITKPSDFHFLHLENKNDKV